MENINNNRPILQMRTVKKSAQEIKQLGSGTAMSEWHIRHFALSGVLPCVKAGKKYLINLDTLFEYLENPAAATFKPRKNNDTVAQMVSGGLFKRGQYEL